MEKISRREFLNKSIVAVGSGIQASGLLAIGTFMFKDLDYVTHHCERAISMEPGVDKDNQGAICLSANNTAMDRYWLGLLKYYTGRRIVSYGLDRKGVKAK